MQVETGGEKMTSLPLGHLLEEPLGHEMTACPTESTGVVPAGRETGRREEGRRQTRKGWNTPGPG